MHRFLHIAQDNFYRNLTSEEQSNIGAFNFDHPAVSSLTSTLRVHTVHCTFLSLAIATSSAPLRITVLWA